MGRELAALRSAWFQIVMKRRGRDSLLCAAELRVRVGAGAKTERHQLAFPHASAKVEVAALLG